MFDVIQKLFSGAFKDEKTRMVFIVISFGLYIVWTEWRKEVKQNDSFVMSELIKCQNEYRECEAKIQRLAESFNAKMDSANKINFENRAEIKYLKELIK